MVHILDDNSVNVAHVGRKIVLFWKNIRFVTALDLNKYLISSEIENI